MLMCVPMKKHPVRLVLLLCLEVGLHTLRMKFQGDSQEPFAEYDGTSNECDVHHWQKF
jgi:hypothetical protein